MKRLAWSQRSHTREADNALEGQCDEKVNAPSTHRGQSPLYGDNLKACCLQPSPTDMQRCLFPVLVLMISTTAACGGEDTFGLPKDLGPAEPPVLPSQPGDPSAHCNPDGLVLTNGRALALDDEHLFIVDSGDEQQEGSLVRVDLACTEAQTIVTGLNQPRRLAVNGDYVYWSDIDSLWRATKDGGDVEQLTLGGGGDIVFDESYLYYPTGSQVKRFPLAGGPGETLAMLGCGTDSVAVDETHVYASQSGCARDVMRFPKEGGPIESIAVLQQARNVIVDDTHVYWVRDGDSAITAWPKTGGDGRVMPEGAGFVRYLSQTDDRLFFPTLHRIGSHLKAGSLSWEENREATAIALAPERIYRVFGGLLSAIAYPPSEEPTGFPGGSGSITIQWSASCSSDSLVAIFLDGPSRWNSTVDCNAGSHTFNDLAPGDYGVVLQHPYTNSKASMSDIAIAAGETVVGPIDLLP